jgi:hypothetical protein
MNVTALNRFHCDRSTLFDRDGGWVERKSCGFLLLLLLLFTSITQSGCAGTISGGDSTSSTSANVPPVAITLTLNNATITAASTQQFVADVSGASNTAVTWTVSGASCAGATCGTISGDGLYTSPANVPSPPVVAVKATSMADPTKSASASVTIVAVLSVLLSISPTSVIVPTTGTQLFTASVTGSSNTAVSWSLSGAGCSASACGSLSASLLSAVYSRPVVAPSPATASVVATSVADPTKSASANVTIVPTVAVTLNPANVSVTVGSMQQFAASVAGTSNTLVTWTVSGTGCSGAACGTIDNNRLYTAPMGVPYPNTVTVTATSAADSTKSASAAIRQIAGATYYLAPAADGGSDSNSGTSSGSPWLTPNHAVNCGDVIIAAAGTYGQIYQWGTVTCSGTHGEAHLACAAFDTCKSVVTSGNQYSAAIQVSKSNWEADGWEATTANGVSAYGTCFFAYPNTSTLSIHDIVFANDVANQCGNGGFTAAPNGSAGVDYVAFVGDIAYDAAQSTALCDEGFAVFEPAAWDSTPGTHIYFGGDYSYNNIEPATCDGAPPTDGEGFMLDTIQPYGQQIVVESNISIFNGGSGIKAYNNATGTPNAQIYFVHNTTYGNETGGANGAICSEIGFQNSLSSQAYENLSMTSAPTGCHGAAALYVLAVSTPDSTVKLYDNYGYSAAGNNSSGTGAGFSFGPNNIFGANPIFANPVDPGAPRCGSASGAPNCMAAVIANFTPTASAAVGYGYQVPSTTQVYDPLFPQWLCNANLPAGLVTMGCLSQ